jgi:hypothetical protein
MMPANACDGLIVPNEATEVPTKGGGGEAG